MTCLICAVECLTPLGMSLGETWDGLVRGSSGVRELTRFEVADQSLHKVHAVRLSAELPCPLADLPKLTVDEATWLESGFAAATVVIERVMEHVAAAGTSLEGARVAFIGATALGGQASLAEAVSNGRAQARLILNQCQNMAGASIATRHKINGPSFSVEAACASATQAVLVAEALLNSGAVDAALVHAHEFPVHPISVGQFSWIGALHKTSGATLHTPSQASRPFSLARRGFVLAESAGAILLCREDFAMRRKLPALGLLLGGAATSNCDHPTRTDEKSIGDCMRRAVSAAKLSPSQIGMISAHATSTPVGDKAEALAIREVFRKSGPSVTAHKGQLGHALGASGMVQLAMATRILQTGVVPPTPNFERDPDLPELDISPTPTRLTKDVLLLNAFGFGGTNASLVVAKAESNAEVA